MSDECSLCGTPPYNRVDIVGCGHSFCFDCLQFWIYKPSEPVYCPQCNQEFREVKVNQQSAIPWKVVDISQLDVMQRPIPLYGPYDVEENWPFNRSIGNDWKLKSPIAQSGQSEPLPLQPFQLNDLKSELIINVVFEQKLADTNTGSVWVVNADYQVQKAKFKILRTPDEAVELLEESVYKRFGFALKLFWIQNWYSTWSPARYLSETNRNQLNESLKEMQNLRYLRQENICNLAEVIGIPDRVTSFPYDVTCMFTELCHGDLRQLIAEERDRQINNGNIDRNTVFVLSESLSRHWFAQIARGLAYIQSQGITQGDMHHGNYFYQIIGEYQADSFEDMFLSCRFKLADFGLAWNSTISNWEEKKDYDVFALGKYLFKLTVPRPPQAEHTDSLREVRVKLSDPFGCTFDDLSDELIGLLDGTDDSKFKIVETLHHPWLQMNTEPRTQPYIMSPSGQYNETVWDEEKKKFVLSPSRQFTEADWIDGEQ